MNEQKPREWWIFEPDGGDAGMDYDNFGSVFISPKKSDWKYWDEREIKPIHVIEYSAYETLQAKLERAREALKDLLAEEELQWCHGYSEALDRAKKALKETE